MNTSLQAIGRRTFPKDSLAVARNAILAGCGGAYGFNTETSMGPAVPPIESIEAMVGKDHLWPIDDVWNYHAGGGEFKTFKSSATALSPIATANRTA
jgi:exo-1,4-beta-D-glucosaminidase